MSRKTKPKTKETFSRYDTADYLKDEASIVAYFEAAIEEAADDPTIITVALGNIARARNMSQLAREVGISREGLYTALSGQGNPSFAVVLKVAKAMGLRVAFHQV